MEDVPDLQRVGGVEWCISCHCRVERGTQAGGFLTV